MASRSPRPASTSSSRRRGTSARRPPASSCTRSPPTCGSRRTSSTSSRSAPGTGRVPRSSSATSTSRRRPTARNATARAMDLLRALEDANLAVLVSAVAHLTGDESWLDRYDADSYFRLRNPPRMDDDTAAEIRAAAAAVLAAPRATTAAPSPPSPELLVRIATFCAGEPVDPDYGPLIAAESDFDGTDPRRYAWDPAADTNRAAS